MTKQVLPWGDPPVTNVSSVSPVLVHRGPRHLWVWGLREEQFWTVLHQLCQRAAPVLLQPAHFQTRAGKEVLLSPIQPDRGWDELELGSPSGPSLSANLPQNFSLQKGKVQENPTQPEMRQTVRDIFGRRSILYLLSAQTWKLFNGKEMELPYKDFL